ncbi:hypothetical protein [Desulfoluna butyratoxydans]|uniref:Uncharacterized protein n=1 Tax=Desulfoluna butyratoxydans TaxID=231438 RepID=A0A4U8YJB7_9BACT|nr:hypothetical protein [Desulfoluna butyratoxydans]VFQ43477.1 hypothetical protein MSL71_11120 [Desulfoluna butyratoxydans]
MKMRQEEIPKEFTSRDKPIVETVGDLLEYLKMLPRDMPVETGLSDGVMLAVYNVTTNPVLEIEEIN